jgi:hypothetical protein
MQIGLNLTESITGEAGKSLARIREVGYLHAGYLKCSQVTLLAFSDGKWK